MEVGIAANTYGASPPGRNTGHTAADTTDYNASIPTRCMDHTVPQFHPKIDRNNGGYIPARASCVPRTNKHKSISVKKAFFIRLPSQCDFPCRPPTFLVGARSVPCNMDIPNHLNGLLAE